MMTSEMRPCIQRRCRRKVCIAGGHGESYVNLALPHLKMKCIKISYFADHNNGIDNFVTRIYTIPGICTYFKISAVDRNVSERLMKPRIESTTCCKVPSLGNTVRLDRIARGLHFEFSSPGGGRHVDTTISRVPSKPATSLRFQTKKESKTKSEEKIGKQVYPY